ncbi:phenoloxidase 1-like isoform X2 [Chrysoperla carnea]|uniref:phenoloxidase 1-like isoform X2 n=1 Tax=Chrysoperla carnea TaxID=189513 RepID=UPI001D0677E3|nr:phenoloxidase 1-like isoform X2 [Chrysoperla carnea]
MSNGNKDFELFFDRPTEPVFVAKGDRKAVFDVPSNYLTNRYKPLSVSLTSRFGEDAAERIPIKKISLPNTSEIEKFPRREPFTVFIPYHRELAAQLINIMIGMKNTDDLKSLCAYIRDRCNPFLFNYALSVALLHREDTQGVNIPNFMQSFPEKYLDSAIFARAREEATVVPEGQREPIELPRDYTASDLEPENRLSYFREDLGVNLHHWHWHLVYPFEGPRNIVAKDRRGELFYYMHQQIIARYNAERLCNKLARVQRLTDLKSPLPEAYFPKLDSLVASRAWPARPANTVLQNLRRPVNRLALDVDDLIRWRDRIFEAINSGFVRLENGGQMQLTEVDGRDEGIDILGNMIEASPVLSPNIPYYGNIHNSGHMFISYSHDPDHRYLETFGVMGDSATAMRDPIFYRWHAFIDDIFQQYKSTLPRYTVQQLEYQGITIPSVEVQVSGGPSNVLQTFWQQSDVDLSRGMDFTPRGEVNARFTHLQHSEFTYRIQVDNATGNQVRGTCRIFLAPTNDERGVAIPFTDHRKMFIELDRFIVTLDPGSNDIQRQSSQSSVTIPFERTFRNLDTSRPVGGDELAQFNFCGCGWPQHMLIPKGSPEGFPCKLFVMISNIQADLVEQDTSRQCSDSSSYCGIKDSLYPDRRSMGFPFDREPRNGVNTLNEFLTPNMHVQDVSIRFTDRTIVRGAR